MLISEQIVTFVAKPAILLHIPVIFLEKRSFNEQKEQETYGVFSNDKSKGAGIVGYKLKYIA